MNINLQYVTNNIERFHKTVTLLASRLVGVLPEALSSFPIIVRNKDVIFAFAEQGIGGDTDYITPYVMNGAFSLEMCIKLLRFYETGSWVRGHNLLELYNSLNHGSKEYLVNALKNKTKKSKYYKDMQERIHKEVKIDFSWDLLKLIRSSANAFDDWRYAFESKVVAAFAGYNEIRTVILERANHIKSAIMANAVDR